MLLGSVCCAPRFPLSLSHHWQDVIRPWMNSRHHQCRLIVTPHRFTRQIFPSSVVTCAKVPLLSFGSDPILNNFTSYVHHRKQQTIIFGNKLSPSLPNRDPLAFQVTQGVHLHMYKCQSPAQYIYCCATFPGRLRGL